MFSFGSNISNIMSTKNFGIGIAEILSIGDEITSGAIADTNAQWLSIRLEQMGLRVLRHVTVGDDLTALTDAFRTAIERADVVVATGGLGPTADDLTREALAKAAGVELAFFPDAYEHCRRLFERRGRVMPEQNRLQAISPVGTRHIPNPDGTALGIDLSVPRNGRPANRVFCVPGVPAEMRVCWNSIDASLREMGYGQRTIVHRLIHCFGVGESQAESMLPDLIRRGRDPLVGITAKAGTITLRIQAEGDSVAQCEAKIAPVANQIRTLLREFVYGEGETTLADAVIERLVERGTFRLAVLVCGDSPIVLTELSESARRYRQSNPVPRKDVPTTDSATTTEYGRVMGLLLPDAATLRQEFPDVSDEDPIVEAQRLAEAVRAKFQAEFGLAVVASSERSPTVRNAEESTTPRGSEGTCVGIAGPGRAPIAFRTSDGVHPAIRELCVAKAAWNAILRCQRPSGADSPTAW